MAILLGAGQMVNRSDIYGHRRIQGGAWGHVPPPRPFEMYSFFGVILFTSLEVSCQIGLLINVSIAGDQRMCGKNRAGFWRHGKFLLLPPPPLNRAVFWRQRKFLLLCPPPPVSCCAPPRLPALDPPLMVLYTSN